jgi:adenylate cyclase
LAVERVVRRLAAVLAADVEGYSRLMGRDEHGTLARLKAHRTERLKPALARHGGRLVKLTGDGALVEFASAVDALCAAIEFQQAMVEANRDQPADAALVFRMGLHLGDLIVDGDDLYGDGVNIAARLEAEAPAGGIIVSRTVHEAVAGRLEATFDDLGSLSLKNIDRPIHAFAVKWRDTDWEVSAAAAMAPPFSATSLAAGAPLALPEKPSIAVLPFQNMSGDPEQEYFADGMVEDIITALSQFKSLFVIARNSSFTYKGTSPDLRKVARELGVRYVMEGSVRKAANRVRISAELIDSANGAHLWADRFDGSLEHVFELQDQVTRSVVGSIAPTLEHAEVERARRQPVITSYDAYLQGMAFVYRQSTSAWKDALKLFYRAIELDPDYATPYAMAARCLAALRQHGRSADREGDEAEARRLALRAARLAGDDALTLCWTGYVLCYMCHDLDAGAGLIDRGIASNENLAVGWQLKGLASFFLGQHEDAVEQTARAMRLNPRDPEAFRSEMAMAAALLFQGQVEEAARWVRKCLARDPDWPPGLNFAVSVLAHAGSIDEARNLASRLCALVPGTTISKNSSQSPLRRPQDIERMAEGLRLAGIPE